MDRDTEMGSRSTRALDVRLLRFQNRPDAEEPAMLTRDLLAAGHLDDARWVFEHAIEREPDDLDLLLSGGELFLERGDFDWAKRLLILAAHRSQDWASPWLALARVLMATRDLDRAEAVLERCWELAPDAPETWALDERLSGESALERRTQTFLRDPCQDDPAMLANALIAAEREDEALRVLDRGLEVFPDDVDALFVRARLHEVRGELKAARADLARATGSDQSWATAWEALEDVCRRTGDHAAARRAEASARSVRERRGLLADLDNAFLVGAAEILTHDLATLHEEVPPSEFAPVPSLPAPATSPAELATVFDVTIDAIPDAITIDTSILDELAEAAAVPFEDEVTREIPTKARADGAGHDGAGHPGADLQEVAEAGADEDLFPTYQRVHETLPPPPRGTVDTLVGLAAPIFPRLDEPELDAAATGERGLRGTDQGRKPYVPPAPSQLRPRGTGDEVAAEPGVVRRSSRSWAR